MEEGKKFYSFHKQALEVTDDDDGEGKKATEKKLSDNFEMESRSVQASNGTCGSSGGGDGTDTNTGIVYHIKSSFRCTKHTFRVIRPHTDGRI